MPPTETRMLDAEGTRLHARLVGEEGLPLLIVMHGGPGLDHTSFAGFLDPLADTVRLALLDLRANGRSDRSSLPETWTLAQMARDVSAVARALGAEPGRYGVFRHSFGSFVALQHAADHPGEAGVTVPCCGVPQASWLDSIPAKLDAFEPAHLRERVRSSWADEAQVQTEAELAELMDRQWPWHFADPEDPRIAEFAAQVRAREPRFAPDILRAVSVTGYGGLDVTGRLAGVPQPVLALGGRFDRTCPPEASEEIARLAPRGEVHLFEQSGHMPFVEQPDEFLGVMRDFLRRHLVGRAAT